MQNVKGPNISATVMGIKCDNSICDFIDMSVKPEDYPQWLNKPCPKCGANLLTQEDYDAAKFMLDMAAKMNEIEIPKTLMTGKRKKVNINFNGSGKPQVSVIEDDEEENL